MRWYERTRVYSRVQMGVANTFDRKIVLVTSVRASRHFGLLAYLLVNTRKYANESGTSPNGVRRHRVGEGAPLVRATSPITKPLRLRVA